ncbi:hypothetical protein J3459_006526 [Metarhizium acridum]|nr:hypothetical protein J3459_006526 [Metarhizium acridum]
MYVLGGPRGVETSKCSIGVAHVPGKALLSPMLNGQDLPMMQYVEKRQHNIRDDLLGVDPSDTQTQLNVTEIVARQMVAFADL